MRRFICRLRSDKSFAVCVLGLVIAVTGLFVFHTYASLTPEEQAKQRYDQLMTEEVVSVLELADTWSDAAWNYIEVAIPGATCWTQTKGPLPVDTTKVSKDFLENVIWYLEGESEVPVAEVIIYQDRRRDNRDICFLNSDYKPIYVIECPYGEYCADDAYAIERYPDLYSGKYDEKEIEEIIAHLDPARVLLKLTMVPSDRLYDYLLDQAKGAAAKEDEKEEGGGGEGAKSGGGSNDLWVAIVGPGQGATNGIEVTVHLPTGFTNMIDVFTFDAEPENTFDGIQSDPWVLSVTNADTTGTNQILWVDTNTDGISNRFYVAGSSWDQDGDGLASAREIFIHRTDPGLWDTDGDGFSDGDEINVYSTDALDKYSVPPPQMLSVSGSYLVDESTNPVTLKSVNIGGWLAFEQWMVKFLPQTVTNALGYVSDDHMPQATLEEVLVDNVDYAVTRQATNNAGASGTSPGWSWYGPSVSLMGGYGNGDWIRFVLDCGAGIDHLSVILARGTSGGNPRIDVRLGSPSGSYVGALPVADTGGWCDWTDQKIGLWSNVVGVQTVYLVAASSSGDVGNIQRVRFYDDDNTRQLFDTFRDNYFTTNDLDNLKALGYNCIRLPFLYDLIQGGTGTNYLEEGWARLDWVIEQCRIRHMWCILDLHGTPGAQNGQDHSGQPEGMGNKLWSSTEFKARLNHLWKTVAARYSNETTVTGYDLFNEPDPAGAGSKSAIYSNTILPVLRSAYSSVRSNDSQHLVFMMSNFMYTNMWDDVFACPSPAAEGWSNVVYQFHHYDRIVYGGTGSGDFDFENQKPIADDIVRTYTRFADQKQTPVFIGEFMPVKVQNFDYFMRQFEANGISWANWNYRHWGHDDSGHPWSSWGLDYRPGGVYGGVNTNIQPNVQSDSLAVLSDKLAQYAGTNYVAHPYLPDVVQNTAKETTPAGERTEFYLNTFDGPDAQNLTATNAWAWRKVVGIGNADKFWIQNNRAHLRLASGPVSLRFASRAEADARFEALDDFGSWFSIDVMRFDASSTISGPEAEIRLSVSRDAVTNLLYQEPSPAVIARLSYDQSAGSSNVYVCLYSRTGSVVGTYGTMLSSNTIAYSTGMTLRLHMNATTALVAYNGVTNSGSHSQGTWPGGAVCIVEAEDKASGGTVFAEVDNLKARRPDATFSSGYTNTMADYPSGIYALAEPERLAIRTWDPENDWENSYMTNGTLLCIPEKKANGWQCVNPRRDYQNDVRLSFTPTNVVEVRTAYTNFTQGIAKICAMPEYFPGQILEEYQGNGLYVEMSRSGTNLQMTAYRHFGVGLGGRATIASAAAGYVESSGVSLQFSTNTVQVYYGTSLVVDALHGLTNVVNVFTEGVYPHYEFLNATNTTTAVVEMHALQCEALGDFTEPQE